MAHVAVVRRSMRPEEWTDLRFVWLQRGIVADQEEVTGLRIRDARQISENEYSYPDGEERPLRKGDLYFTPDGTAFIRGRAVIPERFRGQKVYLSLKTAAEMIVRVNGSSATSRMMNGMDRPMLMIQERTAWTVLCGQIDSGAVMTTRIPSGVPST